MPRKAEYKGIAFGYCGSCRQWWNVPLKYYQRSRLWLCDDCAADYEKTAGEPDGEG